MISRCLTPVDQPCLVGHLGLSSAGLLCPVGDLPDAGILNPDNIHDFEGDLSEWRSYHFRPRQGLSDKFAGAHRALRRIDDHEGRPFVRHSELKRNAKSIGSQRVIAPLPNDQVDIRTVKVHMPERPLDEIGGCLTCRVVDIPSYGSGATTTAGAGTEVLAPALFDMQFAHSNWPNVFVMAAA